MKNCRKCDISKNTSDFYRHQRVCKTCYREASKNWRSENKLRVIEVSRKYYADNKDKLNHYKKEKAKYRRKNDILYSLKSKISSSIRTSFLRNGCKKNCKTEEILGCSIDDFKIYLESKFESWMNWDNRGIYNGLTKYGWDIDHIIPMSSAKNVDDIIKLSHYTNLQPLCSHINRDIKRDIIEIVEV